VGDVGGVGGASANVRAGFLIDGRLLVAQLPVTDLQATLPRPAGAFSLPRRVCNVPLSISPACRPMTATSGPWLRHAAWPTEFHPLSDRATGGSDLDVREVTVDTYRSCASKAMACTRFRSGRSMPGSSSQDIFDFQSSAKRS